MPQLINVQQQFSDNHQQAPYVAYDVRISYKWDNGQLQLPVAYVTNEAQQAAPDPTTVPLSARQASVNIQVTTPRGKKLVTFAVARLGLEPVLPDPTPKNENEVLDLMEITTRGKVLQDDGVTYMYFAEGFYTYNLTQPLWATDGIPFAATDADITTADQYTLDPSNYKQGLV